MRIAKVIFFIAAFSLIGFTAGCRGCGCRKGRPDTRPPAKSPVKPDRPKKSEKPEPTKKRTPKETKKVTPKPVPDPTPEPKRGGDDEGKF